MGYPVTGFFEIVQCNNNQLISIKYLVETTWLTRYHKPIYIVYGQGYEFIDNEIRKPLIET